MSVLMVAEKPILAESIAKILSDGKCYTKKGWNGVCSVSEFVGTFMGRQMRFKMTSTCGHVMGVDFPSKYNNWDHIDPIELFLCPTEKKEANSKLKMPAFLESEAKGCDYLILWLDCDKEGENICFEVIDAVKKSIHQPSSKNFMDVVFRARFSAISEKEIKQAMKTLVKPNLNESLSVDARQELDLRIGCSFTRFQTKYFQGKYGDLDSSCISYGPCQTPTLAFCVNRYNQIMQFKPELYWVLNVEVEVPPLNRAIRLNWERKRVFDRDVGQLFLNRIKNKNATVLFLTSKDAQREKPLALNTVEYLRVASSALGLSPTQAMSIAEHLYTRGYISYPRTETTAYPSSFDFQSILKQQSETQRFGVIARQIQTDGISKPHKGEDKGDHPPITPMKCDDGFLSGDNFRVYEYICQHFLATLMHNCKYKIQTANEEMFSVQSKKIVDPGFTSVMTRLKIEEEESLDGFNEGNNIPVKSASLIELETGPPGYLTESELITLMEKYRIGTDASISVHINNICVESGRRLVPTKLGIALIQGFFQVDHELIEPTMRADVEKQLNLIALGKADYKDVKDHTLEMFRKKFLYYVEHVEQVDVLFQGLFTSLADSGKPFSRCGKCRRFMKMIETKPQRLFCLNCQETYSLPAVGGGDIRLCGERKCPIDEFDLLYVSGKLAKSFAFCPHCFNHPPNILNGMRKGVGCNECPHPGCSNSYIAQGVMPCLTECNNGEGVLVLDSMSGPKWRLTCNKCSAFLPLFEGAWKLKVLETDCAKCGAHTVFVEYKEGKSKLPNSELKYTGCIWCEREKLGTCCVNLNHAYLSKDPKISGNTRGRGGGRRGRGRGKRGRG